MFYKYKIGFRLIYSYLRRACNFNYSKYQKISFAMRDEHCTSDCPQFTMELKSQIYCVSVPYN